MDDIEKYVNENRENLILSKCHIQYDKQKLEQKTFRLLPAHKATVLNIPKVLPDIRLSIKSQVKSDLDEIIDAYCSNPAFSFLMKKLITVALKNFGKAPTNKRYTDGQADGCTALGTAMMDMSIYTFIVGGKALYETLSANLPIPTASTVRE